MKRIGNLYSKIYDIENLRLAHKNARRGKGWYQEVQLVDLYSDLYLKNLQKKFITHTLKTSEYECFQKAEGKKIRTIYKLPYYPDRIAQWAIIQVIEEYLIKRFILTTYSSIPKRGIHAALKDVRKAVHNNLYETQYCLKIDIKHFYQNIDHNILKSQYQRIFKDKDLLAVLFEIIDSINTADLEDLKDFYGDNINYETGIPIGNYLSQYSGNIYLSDFDHWIKEKLKVKYYYRYMDDMVFLSSSKDFLKEVKQQIELYLRNLHLTLKSNWQIFPVSARGIDFVGYRIFSNYCLLRKDVCLNYKKKMKKIYKKTQKNGIINYSDWCSINSYKGWLQHCDSYHLTNKYSKPLEAYSQYYYHKIIRGEDYGNLSEYIGKRTA